MKRSTSMSRSSVMMCWRCFIHRGRIRSSMTFRKSGLSAVFRLGDLPDAFLEARYLLKRALSVLQGFGYVCHHKASTGSPRYGVTITWCPVSCNAFHSCHHEGVHPSLRAKSIVDATARTFICRHPLAQAQERGREASSSSLHGQGPRWSGSALPIEFLPYPLVRRFQPRAQRDVRFPSNGSAQKGVVAVASPDALGPPGLVHLPEPFTPNIARQVNEVIHAHKFLCAEIERSSIIRVHDSQNAVRAVIDVAETSSLIPVTPNLDGSAIICFGNLATDCVGSFLPAALVSRQGTVDVVEPHDSNVQSVVFKIVRRELLRE